MQLRRRAILRLGAAAALGLVVPGRAFPGKPGGRAQDNETATLLREFILQRVAPSTDPWLEMHAVLALGGDFKRAGKNVLDELVAGILRIETIDMRRYPYFPLEIERHPFHVLQVMQAVDVPYERVFVTPHGRYSRRELVEAGTALLTPAEIDDELSWVVSVLCNEFRPDKDRFETARGTKVVVSEIVARHLKETEAAYADVFAVMKREKLYDKGPLHATACNGLHLLYGLMEALRFGYRNDDLEAAVNRLTQATLFRAQLEPLLIDRGMPGNDEMVRLNREAAKFTFFGHLLEDLGYAHRYEVLEMGDKVLAAIAGMRAELASLTASLTTAYDLDRLRDDVPQAYKLILGDACHAYRGIRFWT